ncbi:LysR substrate-binding domain-containing protein [Brevibacterium metallidurans]|uniref:LysR family transcriptional regulator n=1 Tax=Brevibacterium metallidurans TaxID=1482676 RepID=A0ABN0SKP9_9MICO
MALDFTLVQLRYFQEVARRENMTEAARHLKVTQSAISTAVSQLERSLGIDLFIRQRNRTVVLSPAGRRFLAEVNAVLEASEALGETALGLARSLSGTLSVGVFSPIAPTRLPLIHDEFEKRYPDVRVNYLEADLQELQRAVVSGECDMALTYTLGLSDRFDVYLIDVVHPHVLVSQQHRLGGGEHAPRSIHLRELAAEDYIQLDMPYSRQYNDELFRIAGIVPRIRHSFSGYETVRSFVAMGHGYSLLSQSVSSGTYIGSNTVDVPLLDDFPSIDLAFIWPKGLRLNRRARAFCELTTEILVPTA